MYLHCVILFFLFSGQYLSFGQEKDTYTIYVSSISWHTGIVVPGDSFPEAMWREGHNYRDIPYVEIGWGEADFYPSSTFNLWYAIKSVFWPTPSVLHLNPIWKPVEEYYQNTQVVRIELSAEQLQGILDFLTAAFKKDRLGKVIPAAEGLYSNSRFYKGRESYYFPKNSNVWVAKALKSGGFQIRPFWLQTTGSVLNKAGEFGEKIENKNK